MNDETKMQRNVEQTVREICTKIQMDKDLENLPAFEDIPIREERAETGTAAAQDAQLDPSVIEDHLRYVNANYIILAPGDLTVQKGDAEAGVAAAKDSQLDPAKLESSLSYINSNYNIPYYWSLGPAGLKTFFKRVVRKLAKCLIPPILEKQNRFNAQVVNCLNLMKALFLRTNAQTKDIASLKKGLFDCREKLVKQTRFNARVVNCLNAIRTLFIRANAQTEEIASLKKELSDYQERTERQMRTFQKMFMEITVSQIKALQEIYEEETTDRIKAFQDICVGESEKQAKALQERYEEETAGRIKALQDICVGEFEKQAKALQERYDALYSMIALHGDSIKALQSTTAGELRNMIELNENSISALKGDMDCIKRVDASIFSHENQEDLNKYAQSGEDGITAYIFKMMGVKPEHVNYLDLGANHARDLSNTYYFYKSGASGVLVEANPNLIPELKLLRNRDVILNNCISGTDDDFVDFYIMNGDGLSTGNKASVDEISSVNPELKVAETVRVKTISVNTILDQYFSHGPFLLNIDIEGGEMDVLTSLNFEKYRPLVIVVETIPYEANLVIGKKNDEVISYLQSKGYVEYAFTGINSIFVDEERIKSKSSKGISASDTDYTQDMLMNELASRSSYGICLKPGGIAHGPYVVCAAGEYQMKVKVVLFDSGCPTYLNVTAEAGAEQIGRFALKNGDNEIHFSLKNEAKQVEFVIQNRTNDNMYLIMVDLRKGR